MSEKEFKNNRPKSDEKDLKDRAQDFSQKLEPAAKKVKKTVGKIEHQGMHAAEHYMGDDCTMRGAMVLATCGMAVNNAIEKHTRIENNVKGVINDAKELKFQDEVKKVQKMMEGFVKDGEPGIDELLNKTDKYGADVIAQAYVNVAKEIGKDDVWQMTKIDEAFNFEHPVFEREFDFIRSHDPEADAALDFLDMEMGRER